MGIVTMLRNLLFTVRDPGPTDSDFHHAAMHNAKLGIDRAADKLDRIKGQQKGLIEQARETARNADHTRLRVAGLVRLMRQERRGE